MKDTKRVFLIGLLVTLVVAVIVAQFASSSPDGLEHVADQQGFAANATDHGLSDSPLADYGDNLTDNSTVNTAVAGAVGVLMTLALGYGVFWLTARRSDGTPPESA
jgi:ABC-type spermidine/putrescine transport system permease subunit I